MVQKVYIIMHDLYPIGKAYSDEWSALQDIIKRNSKWPDYSWPYVKDLFDFSDEEQKEVNKMTQYDFFHEFFFCKAESNDTPDEGYWVREVWVD